MCHNLGIFELEKVPNDALMPSLAVLWEIRSNAVVVSLRHSCCSSSCTPMGHSTLPFLSFYLAFVQTQQLVASPLGRTVSLRRWVVRIPTIYRIETDACPRTLMT